MRSLLLGLFFAAAPAFASDLNCFCEGPNMTEEMICSQFGEAPCEFSNTVGALTWNQAFTLTASGILYTWYSDKNNVQQMTLTPGLPVKFQYYGDKEVYTMTCDLKN